MQPFDVCIVCALYEEAKAVIGEFQTRCDVSFSGDFSHMGRYRYQHTTIQNGRGETLTVLVTWSADRGPVHTALDLMPILHEFHPRFFAMTGICAGYKEKVKLGDLVVAKCAYFYEEGKIIKDLGGETTHLLEVRTASPTSQVLQYANGFDGWKVPVREMKYKKLKRLLKPSEEPRCFIAPMASGMAVRSDDPFPWLRERYNRDTVALDMEAASFYFALGAFSHIHALVVKGVCDYADMRKNDQYHDYAARASAVYLLCFIQEYVNEQTMPPYPISGSRPKPPSTSAKPTSIRVISTPSREGNKAMILFVLDETEHTLEYIRYDNIRHQILFLKEKQQELVRLIVPFATFKPLEKHAEFQIDGVDSLLTFRMSAITSIMNIKVEVGGVEVFHN